MRSIGNCLVTIGKLFIECFMQTKGKKLEQFIMNNFQMLCCHCCGLGTPLIYASTRKQFCCILHRIICNRNASGWRHIQSHCSIILCIHCSDESHLVCAGFKSLCGSVCAKCWNFSYSLVRFPLWTKFSFGGMLALNLLAILESGNISFTRSLR